MSVPSQDRSAPCYPARFEVEDGTVFAVVDALPAIVASGPTREIALREAERGLEAVIRGYAKRGLSPPKPRAVLKAGEVRVCAVKA